MRAVDVDSGKWRKRAAGLSGVTWYREQPRCHIQAALELPLARESSHLSGSITSSPSSPSVALSIYNLLYTRDV